MKRIFSANDAYEYAKKFALEDEKRERFILIYMKEDGTVLARQERGENQAILKVMPARDEKRAIIVSNHASGSCLPNKYDIEETKRMKELLKAKDVSLTDHIIIGYKEFYSFAEEKIKFTKDL